MSENANRREDREFQLEMFRLQQLGDSFNSILTVLIGVAISWIIASNAIIYSAGVSSEVKQALSLANLSMLMTLIVGCIVFTVVNYKIIPRETDKLRKRFVEPVAQTIETEDNQTQGK
jgi:glucan phosphoethanolaminetransferase (alkaline phosphatase superfamily)